MRSSKEKPLPSSTSNASYVSPQNFTPDMAYPQSPPIPPPSKPAPVHPSHEPSSAYEDQSSRSVEDSKRRLRDTVAAGALCYKAIDGTGPEAEESKRLARRSKTRLVGLVLTLAGIAIMIISSTISGVVVETGVRIAMYILFGLALLTCIAGSIMLCTVGCCCAK